MSQGLNQRIQLLKTAFVIYEHEDLERAKKFLIDFGLNIAHERPGKEIFFKGYGSEPFVYVARQAEPGTGKRFGGAAYVVDSREELIKAEKQSVGTKISPVEGPPGTGGEQVTLTDPIGNNVILVHGWNERSSRTPPRPEENIQKLVVNYEDEKPRKGRFHRFTPAPAPVHRWGHYGVTFPPGRYNEMYNWYTSTLSLAPSDVVQRGEKPVCCFFHIDRGLEFTDHHSFFFKEAKPGESPKVAHAAFEVHDFDVQQLGHDHLKSKGYELCWGVGRHILGSQIFDYWFDPSSFVVEHYADGDLVNSETEIAKVQAGPQALSVWGPPVPQVF